MPKRVLLVVAVTACALVARGGKALAQTRQTDKPKAIQLRCGDVVADGGAALLTARDAPVSRRHIIQLDGPMTRERRERLERAGIVVEGYIPRHAFVARLQPANLSAVDGLEFIVNIEPFRPRWKVDTRLAELVDESTGSVSKTPKRRPGRFPGDRQYATEYRRSLSADGRMQVIVVTFRGTDVNDAMDDLLGVQGVANARSVQVGDRVYIDAVVPVARIARIADLPSVQFIEDAPEGTLRNSITVSVIQSGTSTSRPVWDQGLHGEGQIVGLIDGTPDFSHCMFIDSEPIGPTHRKFVAARTSDSAESHGTHVAGTLAGDQSPWGTYDTYDGIAYAARISFSDYFDVDASPSTLLPRLIDAHDDGARIHSNSWGDDFTTAYTIWCNQIDQFSHDYEENLVCFAATNGGSLKTPENAKNVLAVGATRQYPDHASHCYGGQGPTDDGRRKPEIYAPGCGISSAKTNTSCARRPSSGTSMACPAIAGAGAIVRQYYTEGFYPGGMATPPDALVPTGALMKATLLNAAVDMTQVSGYPSNKEGWGRLVLDRSLFFDGDLRRLIVRDVRNAGGLSTGESDSFEITVWADLEDLRVTMVFTDPPAAINASNPVVNDLDLRVSRVSPDPPLGPYWGNYFVSGQSAPGGASDPLNNVEQVFLGAPLPGVYSIEVIATEVNQGPQGYAIVVTGQVSDGAGVPWPGFGDYDGDGDNDLADFAAFQRCFGQSFLPGGSDCEVFDIDGDATISSWDFVPFENALSGPSP